MQVLVKDLELLHTAVASQFLLAHLLHLPSSLLSENSLCSSYLIGIVVAADLSEGGILLCDFSKLSTDVLVCGDAEDHV